jgi:ABC-type lipoprotein export system ATPase subunit
VTHEAEVARYARRRIVFGDGAIVEDAHLPS